MDIRTRRLELISFIAVLVTGIILIWLGVPPETLTAVGVGLSGLYGAVHHRPGHTASASPARTL
ncbi:hypothetical protein [Streptomyces avermitilis]|uniref:hypothetical protein n=1 Tax=Streptomyces avermitilis TaxID=33903 RepID=UPI0033B85B6B